MALSMIIYRFFFCQKPKIQYFQIVNVGQSTDIYRNVFKKKFQMKVDMVDGNTKTLNRGTFELTFAPSCPGGPAGPVGPG